MTARLLHEETQQVWQLADAVSLIGRRVSCAVVIDCHSVSREHARLEHKMSGWYVLDLGSANGTLVNGVPVQSTMRLKHGDILRLGERILRFEDDGAKHAPPDEPPEAGGATILSRPEALPVIMLVADLEGFTGMSAAMESSDLASAVRKWCDECRSILDQFGGCLDKFIGDCVFAWWQGGELELREKALAAARAILAIPSPPGAPPFRCGAALHRGQVALCRLPNKSHTLLGSAVNATFRMEALTRPLKQPLLLSAAFMQGFEPNGTSFVSHGTHALKGIPEPMEVFAPENRPL